LEAHLLLSVGAQGVELGVLKLGACCALAPLGVVIFVGFDVVAGGE